MLGLVALMGLVAGGFLVDMLMNPSDTDEPKDDEELPPEEAEQNMEQAGSLLDDWPPEDGARGAETPKDAPDPEDRPDSSDLPVVVEQSQRLEGSGVGDILEAGSGDDTLLGLDGADQLLGFAGEDAIFGGADNDVLLGDAGNDSLSGDAGDDLLEGGTGQDSLRGGDGHDRLAGQEGDDLQWGEAGRDSLAGGDGHDQLFGGADDDELVGHAGDDRLFGGAGSDAVEGGAGNDLLSGQDSTGPDDQTVDFLNGGAGDDVLLLGMGDYGHGGDGGDTFVIPHTAGNGQDSISYVQDFDPTADRIVLTYDANQTPDPHLELLRDDLTGNVGLVLNGQPVALIQHAADLQRDDIELRPA